MSLNGVTRNTTICTMYGKSMQTIQTHQGSETTIWGENETAKMVKCLHMYNKSACAFMTSYLQIRLKETQ